MSSETIFDIARRERLLEQLEVAAAEPGLWDDTARAQKTMQAVARARADVQPYYDLKRRFEDNETLMALAQEESDPDTYESEISGELKAHHQRAGRAGSADAALGTLRRFLGVSGTETGRGRYGSM